MNSAGQQSNFKSRARQALQVHWGNGLAVLRRSSPLILAVPAIATCLIILDSRTGFGWFEEKSTQEILAPSILSVAIVAAALFWARAADFYSRWLLMLSTALFCRELHFWGTNNGIYFALLFLVWHASRNLHSMTPLTNSRLATSLFSGAIFTYALTKTYDRGYWSFIAGWPNWQDTMEESLETTAHLMILTLVVTSYVAWERRYRRGEIKAMGGRMRQMTIWASLAAACVAGLFTFPYWYGEPEKGHPAHPGFPLELSSLCNVNPQLGSNLFLASSDEEHKLTLWSLNEADRPKVIKYLELTVPLDDGSSVHLDDLEDIAWDGVETYYAVSSHRHLLPEEDESRRKKSHGTECALVSFQLAPSDGGLCVTNPKIVTQDLLTKIHELNAFPSIDWRTSKLFSWHGFVKTWQLNIEGLASVDGKLLLGFKDPVEHGHATILRYDPATDTLDVAARPDLGGDGILGLHYEPDSDCLYLLSNNPVKHRFGDSCVWVGTRERPDAPWAFSAQHKVVIEPASAHLRRKASGLTIHDGKVAVCFDSETDAPIKVIALEDVVRR